MNRRCPHLGMRCSPSLQCIVFFEGASTAEDHLQVLSSLSSPSLRCCRSQHCCLDPSGFIRYWALPSLPLMSPETWLHSQLCSSLLVCSAANLSFHFLLAGLPSSLRSPTPMTELALLIDTLSQSSPPLCSLPTSFLQRCLPRSAPTSFGEHAPGSDIYLTRSPDLCSPQTLTPPAVIFFVALVRGGNAGTGLFSFNFPSS